MTEPNAHEEQSADEPIVRDKRRIDPETGELRQPQVPHVDVTDIPAEGTVPAGTVPPAGEDSVNLSGTDLSVELAERTADLQRVQAEYANYRRRVERDRSFPGRRTPARTLAGNFPLRVRRRARAQGHHDVALMKSG